MVASINALANGNKQIKISLNLENVELKEALMEIEKKTTFYFQYNQDVFKKARKVSINANASSLQGVMNQMLEGTNIQYELLDNDLVVLKSDEVAILYDTKVTGKVTDAKGQPIAGVSIIVKGGKTGTAADEKGNFSIEVPNNATLVISALGFASQEIKVNGRTVIPVVLAISDISLDEVVVVGYGSQRKRDLTGSITSVKGQEIDRMPNTNPIASLQGKVAGLTVSNSGQAGAPPVVRIRGVNSTNSASPVYVVDGILLDNIEFLNPADIETIDVLRDPSSIAIYGMRGANGVIAITTKRAARGKTVINLQHTIGVQRVQDKIDMVDAAGFRKLYNAQLSGINAAPFDYTNYTANTNWQDQIFRDALINTNSLSIANSGEKSSTLLNIGYTSQEGVLRNDKFERFLIRLNQEMSISKAFKVGGNINGYFTRNNPPVINITNALRAVPIVPIRDGNSFYSMPSFQRAEVTNPVGSLFRSDKTSVNEDFRVVGSLFGEVKFLKDFTWRSTVYIDLITTTERSYSPLANTVINLGEGAAPTTVFRDPTVQTSVAQVQSENRRFQQDHTLTYNKKIGTDHNITGLLGYTTIYSYSSFINGNRRDTSVNIPNDPNFWYLNVSPIFMPGTYGGGGSESSVVGSFFRASYNYKGKYLLNATIRRDGTSKFAPENRWGTFGSVGVGWVASDEDFMENFKAINFLKFRGAWGTIGNSNGFPDFLWKPGLSNASTAVFGTNAYTSVQAAYLVEPNLKFEVVNGLDLGFDLKAFNNKLSFGFTYYNRTTNDILTSTIIPNDGRSLFTNLGNISNKGIEITSGWSQQVTKNFSVDVSANFSYNVNNVESIGKNFDFTIFGNSGANRTISGYSIGHFFGYTQTGIYQTTAELAKTPSFNNSRPGDIAYADINGDGIINQNDRGYLGTPFPPYSFGGAINLQYKTFDFLFEGQGVAGNKIYAQRRNVNFTVVNYESNRLNAWSGPGTTNVEPILDNTRGNNFQVSSYFLEPGDYFRIRTLQVGYNFNQKLLNNIGIKGARIFISGQNIKTWTKATGYTPEPQIGNILGGGADNGVYPVPAVYTFGLNLTF